MTVPCFAVANMTAAIIAATPGDASAALSAGLVAGLPALSPLFGTGWSVYDSWIVLIGSLVAVSCALPGTFLLLRRQSFLGDALSHAVLPGIVCGYLGTTWLVSTWGWSLSEAAGWRSLAIFVGAGTSSLLCAIGADLVSRWGRLDPSAALGVVYTTLFALGLLLVRLLADTVDLDPGCVLYGNLETTVLDVWGRSGVPRAAVIAGGVLIVELLLLLLCYKELQLATFDEGYAVASGYSTQRLQLGLLAITAAAVVAAFEAVGSILVVAMLVLPPAAARLWTDRLFTTLALAAVASVLSAVGGQLLALNITRLLPGAWTVGAVDASSAGCIALAAAGILGVSWLVAPQYGAFRRLADRIQLQRRIAREDYLGTLFRRDEAHRHPQATADLPEARPVHATQGWLRTLARQDLLRRKLVVTSEGTDTLTQAGQQQAEQLVRSHRLWEAYLAQHFPLEDRSLHRSAESVEHYLGPELRASLASALNEPAMDPHGQVIPPEQPPS